MLCMGGRVNRISRISTNVGKFVASVQKFTNIKMIRIKPVLYFPRAQSGSIHGLLVFILPKVSALKSAKTVLFEFRYEFGIILKLIFCLLKSNKAQSFLRLLDGKCASNNQHEVHALTEQSI